MSHHSDLIATDIDGYLAEHERKELLRFLTCGSVDDGKSTLIGRLFYDAKMIYEDTLRSLERDSAIHGTTGGGFDPALFTDGLKAEREQGITIDVAYRYFSTAKRKFIIADTPGHEQYTRNMATGASTCDLAVILVDARNGVVTQIGLPLDAGIAATRQAARLGDQDQERPDAGRRRNAGRSPGRTGRSPGS